VYVIPTTEMQLVFFVGTLDGIPTINTYHRVLYSGNFENACGSGFRVAGDVSATEEKPTPL